MSEVLWNNRTEVSGSISVEGEAARELCKFLAAQHGGEVRLERRIHKPGRRCLWGSLRRIQVGSPEDKDSVLAITLPAANVEVSPGHAHRAPIRGEPGDDAKASALRSGA